MESPIPEQTLENPNSSDDDLRVVEDAEEEDRISNLPESIIGLILSKLPTKNAIGTAVLSTKWRYLFSSIPIPRIKIVDTEQRSRFINPSFVNFVSHLFNHILPQISAIEQLYLVLDQDYGNQQIDEWFSTAPTCNIRCLRLYCRLIGRGISSLDVLRPFTSLCCLELYFREREMFAPPWTLLFPNLTSIVIHGVNFVGLNSFERSLASCPSLRDLTLIYCGFPVEQHFVIRISVPSLRKFEIKRCLIDGYELMFDTPLLEFLIYCDDSPRIYSILNPCFGSLDAAIINVRLWPKHRDRVRELVSTQSIAKLLAACSNVTTLSFVVSHLALDREATFPISTFKNLIELNLYITNIAGWEILPKFLQYSPILRVLNFRDQVFTDHLECYERFQSRLPYAVPTCLSSHLSEISFPEFKGMKDEVKLVKYFLRTARALERMYIRFGDSSLFHEEMVGVQKDILASPVCSTNCQVDIVMPKDAH